MTDRLCDACRRPFNAPGCSTTTLPYGHEPELPDDPDLSCRDCGVDLGQHHHRYCGVATCSSCGGQNHEGEPCQ